MKTFLKLLLLVLVAGAIIFTVVHRNTTQGEIKKCTGVEITIVDSLQMCFIQASDVRDILNKKKIKIEGEPIDSINNSVITEALAESPYVDTATCFHTNTGKLCIEVVTKQPVLHVMAENGQEYYLDRHGCAMPIGGFNVNLNIATGRISKDFATKQLTAMACYIQDDPFWQPLVQQLHVVSERKIEMYTRLGEHTVILGEPKDIEEKLTKLRTFYKEGLSKAGWDTYSTIDIRYKGIVVGERKDKDKKKHATPTPTPAAPAPAKPTQAPATPAQPKPANPPKQEAPENPVVQETPANAETPAKAAPAANNQQDQ